MKFDLCLYINNAIHASTVVNRPRSKYIGLYTKQCTTVVTVANVRHFQITPVLLNLGKRSEIKRGSLKCYRLNKFSGLHVHIHVHL